MNSSMNENDLLQTSNAYQSLPRPRKDKKYEGYLIVCSLHSFTLLKRPFMLKILKQQNSSFVFRIAYRFVNRT